MSFAAAFADVVDALEAADLRVATRDGDITPPCVYLGRGTATDAGAPLAGGRIVVFYLYYVPIRGVDNLQADYQALDTIYDALEPVAYAEIAATWSSITIKNDSWPAWRIDTTALAVPAALRKGS